MTNTIKLCSIPFRSGFGLKAPRLAQLADELSVDQDASTTAHDAAGDVELTARCLAN